MSCFNLLLVFQLRVRDLEGGLEVEKSANAEANRAVERLSKQIRLAWTCILLPQLYLQPHA